MEIFNVTANATQGKAATGKVFGCKEGEKLWTEFTLDEHWVWNLSMGVVGDASRTSTVISEKPYMGLLPDEADSWSADVFNMTNVNSCWELYGTNDRDHYPSSGSTYDMRVVAPAGSVDWYTGWSEIETPTCPGAPKSQSAEVHNGTQEDVVWRIFW